MSKSGPYLERLFREFHEDMERLDREDPQEYERLQNDPGELDIPEEEIQAFLEEFKREGPEGYKKLQEEVRKEWMVEAGEAYGAYVKGCQERGLFRENKTKFGRRMGERFERRRSHGKTYYLGLRLRKEGDI